MKKSSCSPASLLAGLCAAFGFLSPLGAQSITIGSASPTPTDLAGGLNGLGEYRYSATIGGTEVGLTYPGYNVLVTSGADGGEALAGQSFLAICVNVSYPSMSPGTFDLSTDGSSLSYDVNGTDYWNVSTSAKYGAIGDIVAEYGGLLVSLDQASLEFQERITALTFAFAEISLDGIGATDPLTAGQAQFRNWGGTEITGNVLNYFNEYMAAAGTGAGNGLTLYAAGIGGTSNQDVILIPIPEPSVAALGGLAGLAVVLRRRRA